MSPMPSRAVAFLTGINGFVGQHLARLLLSEGYEVAGGLRDAGERFNLLTPDEVAKLRLLTYRLDDRSVLEAVLDEVRPDVIFHLAARSFVPASLADPAGTFAVNVMGTIHLLEAIRALRDRIPGFAPTVVQASSAEVYGKAEAQAMPLTEETPHRPVNPYAASKVAQLAYGRQAHAAWGLKVITATPFNHIGPGQAASFVVASFAEQLARIAHRERPPVLSVGNLEARRDFTDVRDVCRAYLALARKGVPGETYNICSGTSVAIREILERLVKISGLLVEIVHDPARMRPSDVPDLYGSHTKLTAATGWTPRLHLDTTLQEIYASWKVEVLSPAAGTPGLLETTTR